MVQSFVGEIRMFGGGFNPAGWQLCNGQLVNISDYEALFTLIGTTYGGNGTTNFALPDLRGRIPIGQGNGSGLTPRVIGQNGGQETVTLTSQQMPSHGHAFYASPAKASLTNFSGNLPGAVISPLAGEFYVNPNANPAPAVGTLLAGSLGVMGGSQGHDNMMPTQCVSFIISMFGIFPQFS